MIRSVTKVKASNLLVYLLFISIFLPSIMPSIVGRVLHIMSTALVIVYVIHKQKKRLLWNHSIIVCLSIIASSFYSYIIDHVPFKFFLDGVLYAANFYAICSMFLWYDTTERKEVLLRCLLKINSLYCIIALILINKTFGIDSGDANLSIYIFGNKFTTTYLFLMQASLFYSVYCKEISKYIRYKILYLGFFILAAIICWYYKCTTALLASFVIPLIFILPEEIKKKIFKPTFAVSFAIIAGVLPFLLSTILLNKYVSNFITNILHKNMNLSGRLNIYTRYIIPVISRKPYLGYGYTNAAMRTASIYYSNAQNGLLQWIIRFGFIGAIAILVYLYKCFIKSDDGEINYGAMTLVYMMLFASIVEITYNWVFFIGLALLPSTYSIHKKRKRIRLI